MRELKRKGNKCTCPYCGYKNIWLKDADICEHLYEVIIDDITYFYFAVDIDPLGLLKQ